MTDDLHAEVRDALGQLVAKVNGYGDELREARKQADSLERRFNEARITGTLRPTTTTTEAPAPTWIDAESKQRIPVLYHGQNLADLTEHKGDVPTLGRLMRGLILGSKADDARELSEERKALSSTLTHRAAFWCRTC